MGAAGGLGVLLGADAVAHCSESTRLNGRFMILHWPDGRVEKARSLEVPAPTEPADPVQSAAMADSGLTEGMVKRRTDERAGSSDTTRDSIATAAAPTDGPGFEIGAHLEAIGVVRDAAQLYSAALKADGCDSLQMFDSLPLQELQDVYGFKKLHCRAVAHARMKAREKKDEKAFWAAQTASSDHGEGSATDQSQAEAA